MDKTRGKKIAHGMTLSKILTSEQEVFDTIESVILLFREHGVTGEICCNTAFVMII